MGIPMGTMSNMGHVSNVISNDDDRLDAEEPFTDATMTVVEAFNLTRREGEVLDAIFLHGFSNKELAEVFFISEKTVKNHISNIIRKTNTNSTRKLISLVAQAALALSSSGRTKSNGGLFEMAVVSGSHY